MRGKTIAVNALHGRAESLTASVLASHGVPASSVHFAVVPFPAMGAALAAHRVDAAFMTGPFLTAAEIGHGAVPVFDIDQGAAQDLPIAGFVVTQALDLAARRFQARAVAHVAHAGISQFLDVGDAEGPQNLHLPRGTASNKISYLTTSLSALVAHWGAKSLLSL